VTALQALDVFYGGPDAFAPRAAWALDTMLTPLGRRVALTRDQAAAASCTLAYAATPVDGVPTIPCSAAAMELFAAGAALPPESFRCFDGPAEALAGAFPVPSADGAVAGPDGTDAAVAVAANGFAVPFDLVASAFVLLACWDEHTSAERDRFERLPYAASVFAANPALRIEEPAVDGYVAALRALLAPRLAQLGAAPLPVPGWMWRRDGGRGDADASRQGGDPSEDDGPGFAIALTHDLDNLWRWTPRGFAATGYRFARAARRRDWPAARRELGDVWQWLTTHLPNGTDPHWTFPQMLVGEDERGVTSTFFVIPSHGHRVDGNQPGTYRRRIPEALALLRDAGREVGLHGNDRDRRGGAALDDDRRDLERRAGAAVRGARYHYLRCLYHETLPLLDAAGIEYDSSLAFAEHEGFRCGASFPFHPYSLRGETPLALLEVPLALMDTGLQGAQYRALGAAEAERIALEILARVRAGAGGAALLWHNVRFDRRTAQGYDDVYWRLVDWVSASGGLATSAGDLAARWRSAMGEERPGAAAPAAGAADRTRAAGSKGGATGSAVVSPRGRAATRVLHLSVVHRPDDPRIYERECRSLADAGYDVTYLVPGADNKRDAHGVLRAPLPVRGRATRWLSATHVVRHLRAYRPDVVHVHDPELLTLFPAVRAFVPRLVYDMHEYVPEQVAAKHYIPAAARPHAGRATAPSSSSTSSSPPSATSPSRAWCCPTTPA
jgi:peptidoglycan/xylan/chitin deacetylase (PgdA/CDA1 family)